jgi:hypothetical protein
VTYPTFLVFSDPPTNGMGAADASARLEVLPGASRVTGDLRIESGQLDGDDEPELILSGFTVASSGYTYGRVWLLHDIPDGTVDLADADATVFSQEAWDSGRWTGSDVTLCDLDGDGLDNPVFGRAGPGESGTESGEVLVFDEGVTGSQVDIYGAEWDLADASSSWTEVGRRLGCGDFDGSGHDDLVVWALQSRKAMAIVVPGDTLSTTAAGDVDLRNFTRISDFGSPYFEGVDMVFDAVPDATGDGTDELLLTWARLAATEDSPDQTGRAYLMTGPLPEGTPSVLDTHTAEIIGDEAGRRLGWDAAGAQDIDGDGHGDLLIGAYADDTVDQGVGSAWLLFGGG